MVTTFTIIHHSYPFNHNPTTHLLDTTTNDDYYYDNIESENATNLDDQIAKENPFREIESNFPSISGNHTRENAVFLQFKQKDIDEAIEYGLKVTKDLYEIKEPLWYSMGELL